MPRRLPGSSGTVLQEDGCLGLRLCFLRRSRGHDFWMKRRRCGSWGQRWEEAVRAARARAVGRCEDPVLVYNDPILNGWRT